MTPQQKTTMTRQEIYEFWKEHQDECTISSCKENHEQLWHTAESSITKKEHNKILKELGECNIHKEPLNFCAECVLEDSYPKREAITKEELEKKLLIWFESFEDDMALI